MRGAAGAVVEGGDACRGRGQAVEEVGGGGEGGEG